MSRRVCDRPHSILLHRRRNSHPCRDHNPHTGDKALRTSRTQEPAGRLDPEPGEGDRPYLFENEKGGVGGIF